MEQRKRVLLWSTAYADLTSEHTVGGIGVQMMFWAQAFKENDWTVFSLYRGIKPRESKDCQFIRDYETPSVFFFLYFFVALWLILWVRPNLIICRGGRNRNLPFIAFWCRLFQIKDIIFFGSDADLRPIDSNFSKSTKFNIKMFRLGVRMTKFCVVQNYVQQNLLVSQFDKKHILLIPNIWGYTSSDNERHVRDVILWVGNTRKLKRPQWVFEIAKHFPDQNFVIIGGNSDNTVFNDCMKLAQEYTNVSFLGGLSFIETNGWFSKAKVLLCTSEYEGFPNTFLQAWSNDIPVLSTVNPNNLIVDNNLGLICSKIPEFVSNLKKTLTPNKYIELQSSIKSYFSKAHSPEINLELLLKFIDL